MRGTKSKAVEYSALVPFMFFVLCCATQNSPLADAEIEVCGIDLNQDGRKDVALLIPEDAAKASLVVLLTAGTGYEAISLFDGTPPLTISCHSDRHVTETTAGRRAGRTYDTRGAYVKVMQPEASAVAFFHTESGFKEVWLAD